MPARRSSAALADAAGPGAAAAEGSAPDAPGCRPSPSARGPPSPPRPAGRPPSSRCRAADDASPLLPRQLLPTFDRVLSLDEEAERTPCPASGGRRARAGSTARGCRDADASAAGPRPHKKRRGWSVDGPASPSTSGDEHAAAAGAGAGGFVFRPLPPQQRKAGGGGGGPWLAPPPAARALRAGGRLPGGGGRAPRGGATTTAAEAAHRPLRRPRTAQH